MKRVSVITGRRTLDNKIFEKVDGPIPRLSEQAKKQIERALKAREDMVIKARETYLGSGNYSTTQYNQNDYKR